MKKYVIGTVLGLALVFVMGGALETSQYYFHPLRTAVTADDGVLDGTTTALTYKYSDKPSTAFQLSNNWNVVEVIFFGTAAADKVCNYKIWAYRDSGPAKLVCTGVVTTGTAITGVTNTFYCDTITATDYWITDTVITDSGNNRVASLLFDAAGYKWVNVEFDIPAADQVTQINAQISGY